MKYDQQPTLYTATLDFETHLGISSKPLNDEILDELLIKAVRPEEPHRLLRHHSSSSYAASSFILGNSNLNGAVGKKMVEEIPNEVFHQSDRHMWLHEDFLLRPGVVNLENKQDYFVEPQPYEAIDPKVVVSQQADETWFHNQLTVSAPLTSVVVETGDSGEKKRRGSDEKMMDKSIERRQKRMIKNRESAARSRARKQVSVLNTLLKCGVAILI